MHSVGPRIIILCQFGRPVATWTDANSTDRSHMGTDPEGMFAVQNPCLGRPVATWTDANSTDRSHVGTDPVSVRYLRRYPRQFGLPTARHISVYEFGSANRRDADRHGVCPYMRAFRPSWREQSPKWNGAINRSPEQENILKQPCGSSANKKLNGLSLATTLQTRNQIVWLLQQRCKRETKRFEPCNIVANKKLNGLALATVLQTRN